MSIDRSMIRLPVQIAVIIAIFNRWSRLRATNDRSLASRGPTAFSPISFRSCKAAGSICIGPVALRWFPSNFAAVASSCLLAIGCGTYSGLIVSHTNSKRLSNPVWYVLGGIISASVCGVAPPINPMIGFSIFLSPAERVAVRYSSGQSYNLISAECMSLPPAQKKSLASSIASVTLVSDRSESSSVLMSSPAENTLSAKSSRNLSLLLLRLGKFVYPTMPIKATASAMAVDFLLPLSPTSIAYMLG